MVGLGMSDGFFWRDRPVLITGAFGFIGAHLIRRLVAEGNSVTALVRRTSSPWRVQDLLSAPNLQIVYTDLNDTCVVQAALEQVRPETVIHSAWEGVTGAVRNDLSQISRNINASLSLFEAAQKTGCKTFVGIGSQAEYGTVYTEPRRETMLPCPETTYGVAKACVQMAQTKMAQLSDTRFLWFRVFSGYGPQDDDRHILPMLIRALWRRERPALTWGEQKWDFVYIDDIVDGILAGISVPTASGIFNIGSGQSPTLRTVIEGIRDGIDPELPLGFGEMPYRHDQVMLLMSDISRIQTIVGWNPRFDLKEGLRRTVDYYRRYPTAEAERGIAG